MTPLPLPASDRLNGSAAAAVRRAIERFPQGNVREQDIAVTVIDMRDPSRLTTGSFRGGEPTVPASVVKLFYLVAAHRWLEDGKLADSDELRRILRDMIVDSSNDATAAIVDALTETINGVPLPDDQMREWALRRNVVNRYFASLGFTGINVANKTYAEGPYGRERILVGANFENRNKLTTDATARLLAEVVLGRSVTAERSAMMMSLLERDPAKQTKDEDDQATGFTARALPPGTKLWSKAGWTSTARHDAAYIETPDGIRAILVIFTTGHATNRDLLPAIATELLDGLRTTQ